MLETIKIKEWGTFSKTFVNEIKKQALSLLASPPSDLQKASVYTLARDTVELNRNETGILRAIFDQFCEAFDEVEATTKEIRTLFAAYFASAECEALIKVFAEKVMEAMLHPEEKINLGLAFSVEEVAEAVNRFVVLNNTIFEGKNPPDERELTSNEKKVRRLDSLSRLLSLPFELSVCIAVALKKPVRPTEKAEIIIGANITAEDKEEAVFAILNSRLELIRRFLAEIAEAEFTFFNEATVTDLAKRLVDSLCALPSSGLPRALLEQAAFKLIDAVLLDPDTFSEEEKILFFPHQAPVLLGAKVVGKGIAQIIIHDLSDPDSSGYLPLPPLPDTVEVRHIHAEQLIARYLFQGNAEEAIKAYPEPVAFGISKLCCGTCHLCLNKYPVTYRGNHGQTYGYVPDLDNGTCLTEKTAGRAITHAWQSPADTPFKEKLIQTNGVANEPKKGRKRLLLLPDEQGPNAAEESGSTSANANADEVPELTGDSERKRRCLKRIVFFPSAMHEKRETAALLKENVQPPR